jgi:hypothetical protein
MLRVLTVHASTRVYTCLYLFGVYTYFMLERSLTIDQARLSPGDRHEGDRAAAPSGWNETVSTVPLQGLPSRTIALKMVSSLRATAMVVGSFEHLHRRPFVVRDCDWLGPPAEALPRSCSSMDSAIFTPSALRPRHGVSVVDLKRSVFIDDSEKNVIGARAVGMQAIRFTSPRALERDLKLLGLGC